MIALVIQTGLLCFVQGLAGLLANKFRAALTMLGVVIGVAAIVAAVSIGESGKRRLVDEIDRIVTPNAVWFFPNWAYLEEQRKTNQPVRFLSFQQFLKLEERCQEFGTVVSRITRQMNLAVDDVLIEGRVSAVNRSYFDAVRLPLVAGRWFLPEDDQSYQQVCLLGSQMRRDLFGDQPCLGRTIRCDDQRFVVVGELGSKGSSFLDWRSYDDRVFIPFTSLVFRQPSYREIHWFMGIARTTDEIELFRYRVHQALIQLGFPREQMMSRTMQEELSSLDNISMIVKMVVATIAGISLLVGGLGIMNIMLVTVRERTREIGLRKAIGATPTVIRSQFFVESALISSLGGVIGAGIGVGLTHLVNFFTGFPTVISGGSIMLGIGFSILIGIVFGIYPAHLAAALDPAEALRYE